MVLQSFTRFYTALFVCPFKILQYPPTGEKMKKINGTTTSFSNRPPTETHHK